MHRNVTPMHLEQQHVHSRIAKRCALTGPDKYELAFARQAFENRKRSGGQRNTMFSPGLHPFRRNGPNLLFEIDLTPTCASYLANSGSSENQELQCTGG